MTGTVLIVDDHAGFREIARAVLESAGYEVVGEAEDATSALEAVERLSPAIVLLDIQLPDGDGFTVAEALAKLPEPPAVVLVSSRSASDYGRRLHNASALGFIPKTDLSGETLARTVS